MTVTTIDAGHERTAVPAGLGALADWDLWPDLERVTEKSAILAGRRGRYDELPTTPNFWMAAPDRPTFLILDFQSARKVLADGALFSSRRGGPSGVLFGAEGAISESDDPYHARLRRLVMPTSESRL